MNEKADPAVIAEVRGVMDQLEKVIFDYIQKDDELEARTRTIISLEALTQCLVRGSVAFVLTDYVGITERREALNKILDDLNTACKKKLEKSIHL